MIQIARYLLVTVLVLWVGAMTAGAGGQLPARLTPLWLASDGLSHAPAEQQAFVDTLLSEARAARPGCQDNFIPAIDPDLPLQAFDYRIDSAKPQASPRILYLLDPITELLVIRVIDQQGCIGVYASGRSLPFADRSVFSPFPNILLPELPDAAQITVLIQDRKTIRPWLATIELPSFERLSLLIWMGLAAYCGALLIIIAVAYGFDVWQGNRLAAAYLFYIVALLIWIDLFRSFPVLVLLILIFYGLPFLGLKLPSFAACVLALTLNP